MPFIKRINYLKGFTALFILTGISFTVIILFILYLELIKFEEKLNVDKAKYEIIIKQEKIQDFYKKYENLLFSLEKNRFFNSYINNPTSENESNTITIFDTIVENEKYITQLRYIDKNGNELIRVDRDKLKEKNYTVTKENLQNKFHRDYFQNIINLPKGDIYVSKLDLNIEHKEIELPLKPVLRLGIHIYENNESKGVLIINLFGKYLLDEISSSQSFYIDVYDQNNEILVSNDSSKNQWSRYLNVLSNLNKEEFLYSDLLNKTINEEIYIGIRSKSWSKDFLDMLNFNIILITLSVFIVSFILAYYLAKIPKKLFDELELQQDMLLRQSKVAAMGEMTSMLAHQWRQPLNIISILLQEMHFKKELEMLSDEEFNKSFDKIQNTLTHMSSTIDNFRDFFKPKKNKSYFNIEEAIENSYDILKMKFDKDFIRFNLIKNRKIIKENLILNSFEGEFKQVIINILNNAIEALSTITKIDKFIEVSIDVKHDRFLIYIKDNAGGIKTKKIETIFEPYYSTKLEKNGTGLGLYMSKMIIEKNMNGKIKVENDKDGAIFIIEIPKEL